MNMSGHRVDVKKQADQISGITEDSGFIKLHLKWATAMSRSGVKLASD
jgi:hypothetical protein